MIASSSAPGRAHPDTPSLDAPLHDPLLAVWRDRLHASRRRVRALVAPLSPLERHRTPAARAWNVDQILEHLVLVNTAYVAAMTRALTMQADRATLAPPIWRPTFLGGMLERALASPARRLPAPRRARPGIEVRSDVLTRLERSIDELCTLLVRADGVDLRAVRFASPLASLLRLNIGDGFAITATHLERHLAQLERTIERVASHG